MSSKLAFIFAILKYFVKNENPAELNQVSQEFAPGGTGETFSAGLRLCYENILNFRWSCKG